jgi:hypothetical protein
LEKGRYKLNKQLGEWAVELLLSLPEGLQNFSPEAKAELFARIREWAGSRGVK